jgi:hypothetical protein
MITFDTSLMDIVFSAANLSASSLDSNVKLGFLRFI